MAYGVQVNKKQIVPMSIDHKCNQEVQTWLSPKLTVTIFTSHVPKIC